MRESARPVAKFLNKIQLKQTPGMKSIIMTPPCLGPEHKRAILTCLTRADGTGVLCRRCVYVCVYMLLMGVEEAGVRMNV